ncbi:all3515 family Zur-repressed PEP-CTERM protein [Scytonema sp. NUACC26]|uniref:all3515 family Zur-repressed PEP-CTERM protein n=1 Tax=Scytonema sp. NUACC26 TaxID=3140176 RepID=UPI0038B2FA2F
MVATDRTGLTRQENQKKKAFVLTAVSCLITAPIILSTAFTPAQAHDASGHSDETEYFIGLDSLQVLNRGTYTGSDNPNYGRLTFLFAHREEDPTTNHFHGIGVYSYSGDANNPTITPTSISNRIPELYTQQPPLSLLPGTGNFASRLISTATDEEYSYLTIQPISTLKESTESEDQYLWNSSDGRWQASLEGGTIGLQLVSISEGLNVANDSGANIFNSVGDVYAIGSGNGFSFTPTFWTSATAPLGTYSATFRLVDLGSTNNRTSFKESGTFSFDFKVEKIPEPSASLGLSVFGLLTFSLSYQRRKVSSKQ